MLTILNVNIIYLMLVDIKHYHTNSMYSFIDEEKMNNKGSLIIRPIFFI